MSEFSRIFTPLTVGGVTLPNRIVMPSMGSNLADGQGRVTERMVEYYRARAKGGPGLLVVEAAGVHPSGRVIDNHLMIHDESALPGLRTLADAIRGEGVAAVLQLIHGGRNSHPKLVGDTLAPSEVRGPTSATTPRAMTLIEIEAMIGFFARAAELAMDAGFSGVELHGAHEYLIHQFLSPYSNRRDDGYGGSPEARARFACEVVQEVRRAVGPEALLSFRLSGDDHVAGGMGPDDAAQAAQLLERAGVDLISVTGGVYETPHQVVPPASMPAGTHAEAAMRVREAVGVPVAAVGRINSAEQAEEVLGRVDLVAVGRAFLADPQWLNLARQGRPREARPCIGCNQGCIDRVLKGQALACVANPWTGQEHRAAGLSPAIRGARVTVVGGGLAGLEAARTLGALGHQVVLFERRRRLGGQMLISCLPPGKEEFRGLVEAHELALAGMPNVEVRLGALATISQVCRTEPQALIIATGSTSIMPQLPGVTQARLVTARQVLAGSAKVGRRVAVLGGGNLGSEVAHYLASRGREVCIIELGLGIGADMGPARRYLLRRELTRLKVRRYVRAKVRRLFRDRVSFLHTKADGSREVVDVGPVDTFVSAMGARPNEDLYLAMEPMVERIYLVGDALSPAGMGEAAGEALSAALEIHRLAVENRLQQPRPCAAQAGA